MEKRAPDAFYNQFEVSEATQAAFHMLNANILLAHVGDNDQGRNFFHNLKKNLAVASYLDLCVLCACQ